MIKDVPVISTGFAIFIKSNIVGTTSPKFPPSRNSNPLRVIIQGTGFVEWAENGKLFSKNQY